VPVGQKELLLRDTQQVGDEREKREAVLGLGGCVQGVAVEHLHEVLQARYVHLVLHRLLIIVQNVTICLGGYRFVYGLMDVYTDRTASGHFFLLMELNEI
jgi:hypothetical protein